MKNKFKIISAFKIWLVIYPSITLFLFLFGEDLSAFPLHLRTLIISSILVPWMIFIGLPVLESILSRFSSMEKK